MLKNVLIYLVVLLSVFIFSIFYFAWFSWYLLILTLSVPFLSLFLSLPFMIITAAKGVSVFTEDEIIVGEKLSVCISFRGEKGVFCPLMKTKLKFKNSFTGQKKSMKIIYSGLLKDAIYLKSDKFTRNCGCLEVNANYVKIYDMLGIFFIPIRLKYKAEVLIMPKAKEPSFLPDYEHIRIIGYKPNSNGFAEEYELREYQKGDSLRNIHWKISARHNELIVKDPSVPIYRELVLKPVITNVAKHNDVMLGKLIYVSDILIKNSKEFYCLLSDDKKLEIRSKDDIKTLMRELYSIKNPQQALLCEENAVVYTIMHDTEAVSA
ncbi:MAG: DUF58 domain-containing protein [Ruminococcus sp.]|nr:DUF58 domain-containing protein [Ruminococcus sp.]